MANSVTPMPSVVPALIQSAAPGPPISISKAPVGAIMVVSAMQIKTLSFYISMLFLPSLSNYQ
jgi:hypothetical protein